MQCVLYFTVIYHYYYYYYYYYYYIFRRPYLLKWPIVGFKIVRI